MPQTSGLGAHNVETVANGESKVNVGATAMWKARWAGVDVASQ